MMNFMGEQKKRLYDLIVDADNEFYRETPTGTDSERIEKTVDYLLANGVLVPPCKVGDTVWCLSNTKVAEAHVYGMEKWIENIVITLTFKCECECDGCPFSCWTQDYSGEYSCDGEYGETIVDDSDFGKTVFLTREEAEAALAKITSTEKE